eukprot:gnl/MRDRNA2_/MRDRNA2_89755_c0_seq1.p1 gnl/MRDRNA2_/MRDRNA2_89755_c0~~gnl/MRDRNA2_/MRDRNA2_89755_c0_seq1.p1  ORF type:complete len:245 (+),score=59.47 gnl/MRDRNA2_/MRDRNA2_89755_c0_seq1:74-808(+)
MSEKFRSRTRNAILVRDDVGKAKPTCYDLPPEEFAYGRPDNPDFEGAREVTMQWLSHVPGPRPEEKVQDFRKINKLALKGGISSAKDLADFRRHNAQNVTLAGPQHVGPPPKVIPSDVVPAFTYGKKTRPSTPIAAVVSYQFAAEYEQALDENYGQYDEEKRAIGMRRIKTTKAMEGHAARSRAQDIIPKEPFKMKKFAKVQAKMKLPDRDAEMREKAAQEAGQGEGMKRSCSLPAIDSKSRSH